jgi:transposase
MIQRGGEVVIRMLENVQQRTIKPLIQATIALGTCIYTDEYDIYSRLVHVNTMEGFWSLLRSWLRPHRGISQDHLPLYLGFFEFVHNVRRRGKALLGALLELLLT